MRSWLFDSSGWSWDLNVGLPSPAGALCSRWACQRAGCCCARSVVVFQQEHRGASRTRWARMGQHAGLESLASWGSAEVELLGGEAWGAQAGGRTRPWFSENHLQCTQSAKHEAALTCTLPEFKKKKRASCQLQSSRYPSPPTSAAAAGGPASQ